MTRKRIGNTLRIQFFRTTKNLDKKTIFHLEAYVLSYLLHSRQPQLAELGHCQTELFTL